ncbi:CorA metal ion transporter [Cryptotrichosporon argae]
MAPTPTSPRMIGFDPNLPSPAHHRSHSMAGGQGPLSPTRGTGYRDNADLQRQMQQDIDSAMNISAMNISRARSGSVVESSPALPHRTSHNSHGRYGSSPIDESPSPPPPMFSVLSDAEEAEMDRARRAGSHVNGDGSDDGHEYGREPSTESHDSHSPSASHAHLHDRRGSGERDSNAHTHGHGHGGSGQSVGGSSGFDSHRRLLPGRDERELVALHLDEEARARGATVALPPHNEFDFGPMEEFADREREADEVGGRAPHIRRRSTAPAHGDEASDEHVAAGAARVSVDAAVGNEAEQPLGRHDTAGSSPHGHGVAMDRSMTVSAFGDDTETAFASSPPKEAELASSVPSQSHTFHRRRQRKLSQSNPVRRQAKLALFEGFGSGGGNGNDDDAAAAGPGAGAGLKAPRHPKNLGNAPPAPGGIGFATYTDSAPGHDKPYRFSFYSNALPVTIHSRTLAELPAEGQSFEDLFKGRHGESDARASASPAAGINGSGAGNGASLTSESVTPRDSLGSAAKSATPLATALAKLGAGLGANMTADDDPEAFTWWLDVLSPTDEEMRMLSKVFGIHPLTTEDILLEETREKIELFRNYYLVCFRSFDQDPYSQTYLEPLNMYIIVFREGTLSFHFRGSPHPQNVRRRIKHLKDYISVTSDWISYALIDDITDAFGPLIQSIEYEVDSIDELVLILKEAEQTDMLRRIGTCRKKVMGLLRLMGSKADVVKGLAKRCNENWLVAPKSDIGLYLSDIQDHLITMTSNLNHYEKILSRSHSNYLAQISIEMTDANNQINDVLSKLTALGTVLIPMNLVTGLWGMNVHVPGQDIETGYAWFGGIVGCLGLFAIVGAWATYKCLVR